MKKIRKVFGDPKLYKKIVQTFEQRIAALDGYLLTDIMLGLAERRGGTTPLYAAVEEATEELG